MSDLFTSSPIQEISKAMDVRSNNNIKYADELSLTNSCLIAINDDDVQNKVSVIENQVHDNDSDDDYYYYMAKFVYDAYLNFEAMDKFEMYDIAFKNLTPQDKHHKVKKHMLANPSLMLDIYNNLELKEKYHAFLRK